MPMLSELRLSGSINISTPQTDLLPTRHLSWLQILITVIVLFFYSLTAQAALSCGPIYATKFVDFQNGTLGFFPQLYKLTANVASVDSTSTSNIGIIAQGLDTNIYFDNGLVPSPIGRFTGTTTSLFSTSWLNVNSGPGGSNDGNAYYIGTNNHLYRVTATGVITDRGALIADASDTIFSTLSSGDIAVDGNGRILWYTSVNGNGTGQSYLYRIDQNTLKATNLGNYGPNGASGAAFDTTGKLITTAVSAGITTVYSIDLSIPASGGVNLGNVTSFSAGQGVYDLASCNFPSFSPAFLNISKTATNITSNQNPATLGSANDVLEYSITVVNTGNLASDSTTFSDSLPSGTTYVANTTTLNGVAVADISGKMPYDPTSTGSREIHTTGQAAGVVLAGVGNASVIKFRVKLNASGLPATIDNQAIVNYPTVTNGVTTFTNANSNLVKVPTPSDHGDAPAVYGDASHTPSNTLYLGSIAPDVEATAATPLNGTGDDATGTDDEDGVTLPSGLIPGSTATIPVVITGAGKLSVWFDWNRNNSFDLGERVINEQAVTAGTTTLSVAVPVGATAGASYARFRLCSTAGNCNNTTGLASDGEVEDYAIAITVFSNTSGAAYGCDGYFYQTRNFSGSTQLYRIERLSQPYTQSALLNFAPYDVNALGLNKQDGFLYALVSPTSNTVALLKIGQSGAQSLGGITGLPTNISYVSGAFDGSGNYFVTKTGSSNQLYKINPTNLSSTTITLSGTLSSPGDMAFNPRGSSDVLYALNKSTLYTITISTGTVASKAITGISGTVGTAFFDASGTLYAYAEDGTFYQVDLTTGVATQITTAPLGTSTDGASCAYTSPKIDVIKRAGAVSSFNATTFDIPYTLKVANQDTVTAPYVQVVDNLAQTFVAGAPTIAILAGPTVTAGNCTANNGGANKFDGITKRTLLSGTDTLSNGTSCTITFTARITYPSVAAIPSVAQNNSAYASSITSTGTANPGHGFSGNVLIQPPNLLSTDTSTNGATLPATPGGDTASPTPVILSGNAISGTVFEDVNYGGGSGRSLANATGVVLKDVQVELYDENGTYVSATVTDVQGKYTFFGVTAGKMYYVRVVNTGVPSSRAGYVAGLIPVQTFRTNAASGTVVDVTDYVGGQNPTLADAASGSNTAILNTSTFAFTAGITGQAQSVAPVKANSGTVSGVDFGFNFDTIVNKNDTGQGSLRQFILNSNALANTGLAQVGLTTSKETSIFMVSDGLAHPGLRSGLTNQLTSGVAIITASSALPAITDSHTSIDGTTQTNLIGDSNAITLGAGGNVGVDNLSLSTVNGPEVQLVPAITDTLAYGLDLQGSNATVRGMAIYGFGRNLVTNPTVFSGNIHITGSNALVEQNILGTSAKSFTAPATNWTYGSGVVAENTSGGTINNNLIGFQDGTGVVLRKSSTFTITNNEVRSNDFHDYGTMDGISTVSSGGSHTITGNLVINNGACGIDNGRQDDLIIRNNTIKGNGVTKGLNQLAETPGIRLGGSRARVERNIIQANYGAGILVRTASSGNENVNPTRNTFSQNSIFQNGTLTNRKNSPATRQIGIDLEVAGQNTNQGTFSFITPNNGENLGTPNDGMDYPVVTSAKLIGQVLTVKGYIGNTGPVASFGGANIEFFIGDITDYAQPNVQVVVSRSDSGPHWEGQTYLGSCIAYNDGTFNCAFNNPKVTGAFDTSNLTFTATKLDGSTSEFGDRLPEIGQDTLSGTVFLDTGKGSVNNLANNGIMDGTETGIQGAQVTLYNCVNRVPIAESITNGSGTYHITIPAGTPDGTEFCLVERNVSGLVSTGASQTATALASTPSATGATYTRSTDTIKFTYTQGNSYSTLNFGDVPANQFVTDGIQSSTPGNTVLYTHQFTAATQGAVKFSLSATTNPAAPGWKEVLYTDSNCNGEVDNAEVATPSTAINVVEGEKVCLVLKEYIPAAASMGASNLVIVTADFTYTNGSPVLTNSYTRQDLTTVSDGAVELKKRVRNVTLDGSGAANWQVSNSAKSGEILEYQITYTNHGSTAVKTLTIKDNTPAYTTFISATADSLPDTLTGCSKTTPTATSPILCSAADTVGQTGGIEWKFTGTLAPGATGNVLFRVKLD